MIGKILEALCAADETALSRCFAEDGKLYDYCPCVNGGEAHIVYGREGIELLYRSLFAVRRLTAAEPAADGADTGTFFGSYDGPWVYARVTVTERDETGLVRRAVIAPA